MADKRYYSDRHGRRPETPKLSLEEMKRAVKVYLLHVEDEGYFQEHLGHSCVDNGFSPGLIGGDPETEIILTLGKAHLWPIRRTIDEWNEDDTFDMIEFLYAHVSKPTQRHWHDWDGCGWHCKEFDVEEGQVEFRDKVNRLLQAYDSGFELSNEGEVLAIPPTGLMQLCAYLKGTQARRHTRCRLTPRCGGHYPDVRSGGTAELMRRKAAPPTALVSSSSCRRFPASMASSFACSSRPAADTTDLTSTRTTKSPLGSTPSTLSS